MKKILKVIAPMFLLLAACNNNAKPETSTNIIGEPTTTISTGTIDGPTSDITL